MNTLRKHAVALFWLALSAFACLLTSWAARELGAGWRLSTGLGLGAGLAMLVIGGCCCIASDCDDEAGR